MQDIFTTDILSVNTVQGRVPLPPLSVTAVCCIVVAIQGKTISGKRVDSRSLRECHVQLLYTTVQHVLSSMTFNKRNVIETAQQQNKQSHPILQLSEKTMTTGLCVMNTSTNAHTGIGIHISTSIRSVIQEQMHTVQTTVTCETL